MASPKNIKSKYIVEETRNETLQSIKKLLKRQSEENDETDFPNQFVNFKKKKDKVNQEYSKICRQRILSTLSNQIKESKQGDNKISNRLSVLLHRLEEDYNAINETEQEAKQLIGAVSKFVRKTTEAHKQNMETIKDIIKCLEEEYEETEQQHQTLSEKLAVELENDINKLQEKLTVEGTREGWEEMRKSICRTLENNAKI